MHAISEKFIPNCVWWLFPKMSIYRFSSDFTPSFVKMWNAEELIQVRFYKHWAEKQNSIPKVSFIITNSISTRLCHVIYYHSDGNYPCLVGIGLRLCESIDQVALFKSFTFFLQKSKTKILWHFLKFFEHIIFIDYNVYLSRATGHWPTLLGLII